MSDNIIHNLAKPDDGLDESPTVMVVETKQQPCKNRGILKPSWAFVETNKKGGWWHYLCVCWKFTEKGYEMWACGQKRKLDLWHYWREGQVWYQWWLQKPKNSIIW